MCVCSIRPPPLSLSFKLTRTDQGASLAASPPLGAPSVRPPSDAGSAEVKAAAAEADAETDGGGSEEVQWRRRRRRSGSATATVSWGRRGEGAQFFGGGIEAGEIRGRGRVRSPPLPHTPPSLFPLRFPPPPSDAAVSAGRSFFLVLGAGQLVSVPLQSRPNHRTEDLKDRAKPGCG